MAKVAICFQKGRAVGKLALREEASPSFHLIVDGSQHHPRVLQDCQLKGGGVSEGLAWEEGKHEKLSVGKDNEGKAIWKVEKTYS